MSGLNLGKVQEAEEDLKKRGGGGLFLRLAKNESKEIRILDPLPNMEGLYWVEVPQWWIDGKVITSPEFIGETDYIQQVIDEYRALYAKDKKLAQFNKMLDATKGEHKTKVIQKTSGFWIPVLELQFETEEVDGAEELVGIYDENGDFDVEKIKNYVVGGRPSILDAKRTLLKSITAILTTGRGGGNYLSADKGYNMVISRKGEGRNTVYSAVLQDKMPMPKEFYSDKAIDVVNIAKSQIPTNDYIDAVLEAYFEGGKAPEEVDYRFPELREKLKGQTASDESEEEEAPTRSRRRASLSEKTEEAPAAEPEETAEEPEEEQAEEATTSRRRSVPTEGKKPTSRRRRSLADDVADA